jgi:hypothetical protein
MAFREVRVFEVREVLRGVLIPWRRGWAVGRLWAPVPRGRVTERLRAGVRRQDQPPDSADISLPVSGVPSRMNIGV